MTLTMKKMGAAVIAAALALCIAPVVSMLAPSQAHAATAKVDIAKAYAELDLYFDVIEAKDSSKVVSGTDNHMLDTTVYTGKQVKPTVKAAIRDDNYEGYGRTDKEWDYDENKMVTNQTWYGMRPLKVVNVTGKSAKDAAKLAKKKKADLTIEYKNNIEIGTAQVIIKGAYNKKYYKNCAYKGTIYGTFDIDPAQVKKVTVKAAKKALKVSWKKVKGVTGYQVNVREKDSYELAASAWVDAKKKSVKVKGLKAKTEYEVYVYAVKTDVLSKYKYTNRYAVEVPGTPTVDEDGFVIDDGTTYKYSTYTGSFQNMKQFPSQTPLIKVKKTK